MAFVSVRVCRCYRFDGCRAKGQNDSIIRSLLYVVPISSPPPYRGVTYRTQSGWITDHCRSKQLRTRGWCTCWQTGVWEKLKPAAENMRNHPGTTFFVLNQANSTITMKSIYIPLVIR